MPVSPPPPPARALPPLDIQHLQRLFMHFFQAGSAAPPAQRGASFIADTPPPFHSLLRVAAVATGTVLIFLILGALCRVTNGTAAIGFNPRERTQRYVHMEDTENADAPDEEAPALSHEAPDVAIAPAPYVDTGLDAAAAEDLVSASAHEASSIRVAPDSNVCVHTHMYARMHVCIDIICIRVDEERGARDGEGASDAEVMCPPYDCNARFHRRGCASPSRSVRSPPDASRTRRPPSGCPANLAHTFHCLSSAHTFTFVGGFERGETRDQRPTHHAAPHPRPTYPRTERQLTIHRAGWVRYTRLCGNSTRDTGRRCERRHHATAHGPGPRARVDA